MVEGLPANARFGAESGKPTLVTHRFGVPAKVFVSHPVGSAGATTLSKFWLKKLATWKVYVRFRAGLPVSCASRVAVIITPHTVVTVNVKLRHTLPPAEIGP